MKIRSTIATIFGLICVVAFAVLTLVTGINDLNAKPAASPQAAQSGEITEYDVKYATEIYEIQHKLLGLIPTNSEHFYLTMSEENIYPLVVRADVKWYEENFTADGTAKSALTVSGLVKKSSSKEGLNLNGVNRELDALGAAAHIDSTLFLDMLYATEATMTIAAGVLLITAVLTVFLTIILYAKGILVRGSLGANLLTIAAVIQGLAFIVIMVLFL